MSNAEVSDRTATLPPSYPDRFRLAEEVHARPPVAVETPSRATYLALLVDELERAAEREHLARLCAHFGVAPPPADAIHFNTELEQLSLKWERHGEFSSYTFLAPGCAGDPFADSPAALVPPDWIAGLPGATIFAAHAALIRLGRDEPDADFLSACFNGNVLVGAEIGGGAGRAYTDFRIHPDGYSRFLVLDRGFTPRQAGRMLQRLFEIEAYRMMALLALPVAREMSQRVVAIERALAALTDDIAGHDGSDESLLQQLTRLAARVESGLVVSQFRFGACRAYHDLVVTRIHELREDRLPGLQTIDEFMTRRFTPAAATCASASRRLHDLSERVAQASALLSTRVEIARERQNHLVLNAMNRRARLQLRLQQTVEVLSVVPITYYVAGLVGYAAKAGKAVGLHIDPDLAVGVAIPLVVGVVILAMRRAHHRIMHSAESDNEELDP